MCKLHVQAFVHETVQRGLWFGHMFQWHKCFAPYLKGTDNPKMKINSLSTHPHAYWKVGLSFLVH